MELNIHGVEERHTFLCIVNGEVFLSFSPVLGIINIER